MGQTTCAYAERGGYDRLHQSLRSSSHAGGHWFESSSLHQKVPDFLRNQELFLFVSSNSDAAFWRFSLDPNRDPKAEMTGEERKASPAPLRLFCGLHCLADDAADGVGGGALHSFRGVGVGAEGKARVVVAQRTGQRLDIHAVLEGQRGEGVSEVVKSDVLRADGLQDLLMGVAEGVRIEHSAGLGRYEQAGAVWVLCVLL